MKYGTNTYDQFNSNVLLRPVESANRGNLYAKEPKTVTSDFARRWWKALMANTVALVEDAALLASNDSSGRAQSLIVLAVEEFAKARWLYEAAEHEWTAPLGVYGFDARPAGDVMGAGGPEFNPAASRGEASGAEQFAAGLTGFWSLDRRMDYYERLDLETLRSVLTP